MIIKNTIINYYNKSDCDYLVVNEWRHDIFEKRKHHDIPRAQPFWQHAQIHALIETLLLCRINIQTYVVKIMTSVTALDIIVKNINTHSIVPVFTICEAVIEFSLAVLNSVACHQVASIVVYLALT